MALGTRRTPERNSPLIGGSTIINAGPVATVTVASTKTWTAAELLVGFIPANCTDASTSTLPTAALLAAAIPGIRIGNWFKFTVVNYGDSTITWVMGSGITNKVIDGEDAILDSCGTHVAQDYYLVCTGIADPSDPSKSDSFDFYAGPFTVTTS